MYTPYLPTTCVFLSNLLRKYSKLYSHVTINIFRLHVFHSPSIRKELLIDIYRFNINIYFKNLEKHIVNMGQFFQCLSLSIRCVISANCYLPNYAKDLMQKTFCVLSHQMPASTTIVFNPCSSTLS